MIFIMERCIRCGELTSRFKQIEDSEFGEPQYICDPECPKERTPKLQGVISARKFLTIIPMVMLVMACTLASAPAVFIPQLPTQAIATSTAQVWPTYTATGNVYVRNEAGNVVGVLMRGEKITADCTNNPCVIHGGQFDGMTIWRGCLNKWTGCNSKP